MSGVKRYDYGYKDDGFGGSRYLGLIEKPDGKLVLASDYDRDTQALRDELNACRSPPGGCGYWRESARIRETERDALQAQVEAMRKEAEAMQDLLRKVAPHFTAPPGMGYLYQWIDAALQAKP